MGEFGPKTKSNSIAGDSQARVPIRSYYFVGNWDKSLGTYRLGETLSENARDSGNSCKGEKKVAELNHRELIEGAERQLAWGNPRRQRDIFIRKTQAPSKRPMGVQRRP
jgi:hypothetical protein